MSESETLSPAWTLGVAAALLLLAVATAGTRAAAVARRDGRRTLAGAADPLREAARLLRQRPRRTVAADLPLWRIASSALLPVALCMAALVPIGGRTLVPDGLGVVWFNALDVSLWAFFWLLGWGANASFGLAGAYRFLALGLAYELPLMFALVAPAVAAGSLDPATIGGAQGLWYVVWMPVAFLGYCVGVLGFTLWGPLRAPAGDDIATGVLAELSGVDRLLVAAGRYALLVAGGAFAVPLFLGGTDGPWLPGVAWLVVKAAAVVALLVLVGERLSVLRPDKALEAGWVVLLPLVVLQDLVVAVAAVTGSS
jgi:NADH-quinone oxidoreductase subunit H